MDQATHMDREGMPNFLIVGAAKAGTTSLYDYLRQHPDIFMPEWKELSFFIGDPCGPLHKVRKPAYYYKVFAGVKQHKAIGQGVFVLSYLINNFSCLKKIMDKYLRMRYTAANNFTCHAGGNCVEPVRYLCPTRRST